MLDRAYRIVVALCFLAGVGLLVTNLRYRSANAALASRAASWERVQSLAAGDPVRPLDGLDREGRPLVIDSRSSARPVLVLVFSPTCPYCAENWPGWERLVAAHLARDGAVVPVDVTGRVDDEYLRQHGIDVVPVLTHVSVETILFYRFRLTPQTLILANGVVQAEWSGVLTEADVARADSVLGGRIPWKSSPPTPEVGQ